MKKIIAAAVLLLVEQYAHAHGSDRPGPHKGHIRMPGAFHTELLIEGDVALVYLLDVGFKNALTEKSSVELELKGNGLSLGVACFPVKDYFECKLPSKAASYDEVVVSATRNGVKGSKAVYAMPLSFGEKKAVDQSKHH